MVGFRNLNDLLFIYHWHLFPLFFASKNFKKHVTLNKTDEQTSKHRNTINYDRSNGFSILFRLNPS